MTVQSSFIGEPLRRLEDPELLRGEACFVGDLKPGGVLSVRFVRCPLAHARVRSLSLASVRQMPGVVAAFGPHDLEVLARPMLAMDWDPGIEARTPCPLAEVVRFAGEAVAVVVADDPYRAQDAVHEAEAQVVYDGLAPVVDPAAAMDADAPRVHGDVIGNVAGRLSFSVGDIGAAFAQADVTVAGRFESPQVAGASLEPRAILARPGGEEGVAVTLWVSTQVPHVVRRCVAAALDLRTREVQVITPCVGGGFGPKGRAYPEEIAVAALALRLGRACRWEATRSEDFQTTCHGHGIAIEAALAASADGRIAGIRARILQDAGAYLLAGMIVPQHAAEHFIGPYRVPAAGVDAVAVYTNKTSLSPVRGGGREQGVFVLERLLDHLARRLAIDPLELRRRNALHREDFPYDTHCPGRHGGTIVYDSGNFVACLHEVKALVGYDDFRRSQGAERKAGRYRGIAVSLFAESTAMGKEGARVEVGDDGTVRLALGSPDTGQGHRTAMSQICASILGVPIGRIRFVSGDTHAMGVGSGTLASRFTVMGGNATALAAQQVRERALALASELLDVVPQALEIVDGICRVKSRSQRAVALGEVARQARLAGIPLAHTHVHAPAAATTYAGAAHAAIVEVDVETGAVRVERYAVVHDSGTLVNPALLHGQLHGGVALGIGEALGERIVHDPAGRLLTDSFGTYAMPRAEDVPRMSVREHACRSRTNAYGIKGVGENGTLGALPAIIGAVEDALAPFGLTLDRMPVRSEDLARLCAASKPAPAAEGVRT